MSIGQARSKVMALIAGVLLAALFFSASGKAAEPPDTDPIRKVVSRQLLAFKARNSAQAYAALSKSYQDRYKTPLSFATMMRLNFWELYNHASYRFLGRTHSTGYEIQKVEVKDADNVPYIFLFRLISTSDGWRIDNVLMLDPAGQPC